ncbi:ABC transporter ATP-binding protein [Arthrobacter sp. H16F315]|uniref:ABC transporter ATP-binding protein n=1 Tax=Arthrobacter sp. H16F315 TaxID=2955314 RepID=UPI00237CB492|nr:ABC transporter ATP-binding protein [Arthrobacter sp. H16F315]MDD1476909.1 ABC transporter ATP-binding protein [Arthrobacter sp. H16F315]
MAEAMIEFQNVTKQYQGGTPAVDDLTMSIDKAAITVFVGPSGCGKTTSLRMINRMVEPTSGSITVGGEDVTAGPAAKLRRSMGYVMQSSGLMPHRSVLDNIATVPRLNGVSKAEALKRAHELLDVVGLASALGKRYPSQLSGGQQQRVGVARALAADPPVLLMDEPFSAVDPVVRDELQQELLRLQRDLAKTIVFVTHDIDEATVLGDKVAVFGLGGKLAQYATPEEILRAPANDFVASFVGRDRGFRHLAFSPSDGVTVHPARTVTADELKLAGNDAAGWQLLVGHDLRPLGWSGPGMGSESVPGGSLFRKGDTLRRALDAALSSPSGLGVVVDEDGRVAGVITAEEVLAVIESDRHVRHGAL